MIGAHDDPELIDWLLGITNREPVPSGDFLYHLANAAVRADMQAYALLRPALLKLRNRFPKYRCVIPRREELGDAWAVMKNGFGRLILFQDEKAWTGSRWLPVERPGLLLARDEEGNGVQICNFGTPDELNAYVEWITSVPGVQFSGQA